MWSRFAQFVSIFLGGWLILGIFVALMVGPRVPGPVVWVGAVPLVVALLTVAWRPFHAPVWNLPKKGESGVEVPMSLRKMGKRPRLGASRRWRAGVLQVGKESARWAWCWYGVNGHLTVPISHETSEIVAVRKPSGWEWLWIPRVARVLRIKTPTATVEVASTPEFIDPVADWLGYPFPLDH